MSAHPHEDDDAKLSHNADAAAGGDEGHEEDEEAYIDPEDYEVVDDDEGDMPMDDDSDDGQDGDEGYVGGEGEGEGGEMDLTDTDGVIEDNSLGHSEHHTATQSVFSISLHPLFPNPPLAVSGGEDDLAYIFCPIPDTFSSTASPEVAAFNNETFQPIKLTGHTDSVVATAFSNDGEMVATGGMDGNVRIWRRVKGKETVESGKVGQSVQDWQNWEFLTTLTTDDEITWIAWHPKGPVLAAGCNDSTIWMWQLPSGKTMQVFSAHTETTTFGSFTPNGKYLLTTSTDSTTCLWDPREPTPLLKLGPSNTSAYGEFPGGITTLAISPASNLCAVGGTNGDIRIINLPDGRVVNRLTGHESGESIEALEFMDILGLAGEGSGSTKGLLLISGATDGKAIIWDVTNGHQRAVVNHSDVVTGIARHPLPNRHLFTTSSVDKTLKTWDARTGVMVADHTGHAGAVNALEVGRVPAGWGLLEDVEEKGGDAVISAGDEGLVLAWRV